MKSYYGSALLVAGAALGYISALQLMFSAGEEPAPNGSAWQQQTVTPKLGQPVYANAHFRQQGYLPPPRNVQIFSRMRDDDGESLRSDCTYTLTSKTPLSRWWSLTTHNLDTPNKQHSRNASETFINGQNELIVTIAKDHQHGNWLPLASSKNFKLTMVLVEPLLKSKQTYFLPLLKKESCS